MEQLNNYSQQAMDMIIWYGPSLLGAILTLAVGWWVIKVIVGISQRLMDKANVDPSLSPFLRGIISNVLKIMLVISVLGMLGIEMTSFIAILGAAGLAVGLALSGTLQNFAGGVMILLFKPFKKDDFIEAQGYSGKVNEIRIFNTVLKTPDNKTVIIPNSELSSNSLTNYSTEPRRRVDWTIGIGYGDDTSRARQVIRRLIDSDDRILKDPEPLIAVSELADSSVNFAVRVWVNTPDYWGVYFRMNEEVYNTFEKEGLNIPFPQHDVHLHQQH